MDESEVFDLSFSVIFSEMEETERGGLQDNNKIQFTQDKHEAIIRDIRRYKYTF